MSAEKVQQALMQCFITGMPNWQTATAWENKAFKPQPAVAWLAFRYMPVDERIATLGPNGADQLEGMVQIDVNYPVGVGEANSRKTINELRTCFRPRSVTYEGQPVTILSRSRSNGRNSNGFYMIPFTIRWRAQITRT